MTNEHLFINGINGATGEYLLPPQMPEDVAQHVQNVRWDQAELQELRFQYQSTTQQHLGVREGLDPKDLAQTGWGVIFAHSADPAIREALQELMDFRREQATREREQRYKEYIGASAYRPGETKQQFMMRHGIGLGPADPDKMPYYLLIVGDPETIPYSFQYQLDLQYAVGRIYFDTLEEYAQYARSVVAAERGKVRLAPRAAFFGVRNPDDQSTAISAEFLVKPLAEHLKTAENWSTEVVPADAATKTRLAKLLGGDETPALLFTASHGMGFRHGDPRQLPHQGALLCQDWPGPDNWHKPIPQDFYFAAEDVGDDARLLGLIAFCYASYSAGTPSTDDFAGQTSGKAAPIAPHAFVASLPRRLLSHPRGGALAVIGHVERVSGFSLSQSQAGGQVATYASTLRQLASGSSVGMALEYFNQRYAELSSNLSAELEDIQFGKQADSTALVGMWTANNDSRSCIVIGDPAVRLPLGAGPSAAVARPALESFRMRSTVKSPATAPPPLTAPATPDTTAQSAATTNVAKGVKSPQPATGADDSIAFGLFDKVEDGPAQTGSGPAAQQDQIWFGPAAVRSPALQELADQLSKVLKQAIESASLEIATYASDTMSGVTYDSAARQYGGSARLLATSRIGIDGNIQACLPEKDGELDRAVWEVHLAMIDRAQAQRTELFKTAIALLNSLSER